MLQFPTRQILNVNKLPNILAIKMTFFMFRTTYSKPIFNTVSQTEIGCLPIAV